MKHRLKIWWFRIPGPIRKPIITTIGVVIVLAGIAMLALPGPGWGAIFLGFLILSSEFEFAERVRDRLVSVLKWLIDFGLRLIKDGWNNPFKP